MRKRQATYDYFRIERIHIDAKDGIAKIDENYNIEKLLKLLMKESPLERVARISGDPVRMQVLEKDDYVYKMQFLRIREDVVPGIASDDGKYATMTLDEGKHIAEYNAALFDPQKAIFVLHRNRNALAPSRISAYLSRFLGEGNDVNLKPLINQDSINTLLKKPIYRTLRVKLIGHETTNKKNSLHQLFKPAKTMNSNKLDIVFSIGRGKKGESLDIEETRKLIIEAYSDENVDRIDVAYKDDEDSRVETIDLLKDKRKDQHIFELEDNIKLEYMQVVENMVGLYDAKL